MTKFKTCGMREIGHVRAAVAAGADLLGFVFVPGVRRQIPERDARALIEECHRLVQSNGPRAVGLFANQPLDEVNRTVGYCGLDMVQLCGDEPPEYWREVAVPVIRQVKVWDTGPRSEVVSGVLRSVDEVVSHGCTALLDRHEEGALGGTGRSFDWSIAAEAAKRYDVMLAGGLTPENVAQAVRTVSPWGVDVSSGIETDGVKDAGKIARFAQEGAGRTRRRTDREGSQPSLPHLRPLAHRQTGGSRSQAAKTHRLVVPA